MLRVSSARTLSQVPVITEHDDSVAHALRCNALKTMSHNSFSQESERGWGSRYQEPSSPGNQPSTKASAPHILCNCTSHYVSTTKPRYDKLTDCFRRVSSLRLLHQETIKCLSIAENFEERTITDSSSREIYEDRMRKKLQEILQRRQQANSSMSMSLNNNAMGMQPNNLGNMNIMQNGMTGMNALGMGVNMLGTQMMGDNVGQPSQAFPTQLQRQMQPSPLPPQQQQQQPGQANVQSNAMDSSVLQNSQMPPQMPHMNPANPQQQPGMNQGGQSQQGGQPSQAEVQSLAKQMHAQMTEEKRNQLRSNFLNRMNDQQRQAALAQGDPLIRILSSRARDLLVQRRGGATGQTAQQSGGGMQMNNMGMSGNSLQQTPVSQPGTSNFDFSSIMGQQANAIKLAESGEQVVPASNNNNNLNMAGQMNMNQGVNPQMLGTQNNQASNNPQLQQFLAMQQEKQKRERMQQQNNLAQQQALAQSQAQLRGQPGGLNAPSASNGGQVNSPAMNMSMLNRPMRPPGHATPSTPQTNRSQVMPQTPVNPANQLAQHHQNMLNQNSQQMGHGGQGVTPQQQWINSLPLDAREKLSNLPPNQVNEILARLAATGQNGGMMNNQQAAPHVPPNMGAGALQMGNQQQIINPMPPNMGTAVPGFNSQPPPNQQPPQAPIDPMAFQQRLHQHQQTQMRQRAMDMRQFPRAVLATLGISVPDYVNEWGKLKQHITQNQAVLPPNLIDKLQSAQNQWYETHPEEVRQAMQALQQRMQNIQQGPQGQPPQPPSTRPPSSMAMQTGPAPPAQMVPPPTAPMQQPQNQNVGGPNMHQGQQGFPRPQPPTPQDVQMFREKVPNAQSLTDDQIKGTIMRRKIQQASQMSMQMQQSLRNAQMNPRAQSAANGGQPGNVAQGNQTQPQRPSQPQQGPTQQVNNQTPGQKRPQTGNDDVMEIPNPNAPRMGAPQAPAMQPSQSQQQQQPQAPSRLPTKEELGKMNPQQRTMLMQKWQQMEALRKAQMGITNGQNAPAPQPQQPQQPRQPQPQPPPPPPPPPPQQQQANRQQPQSLPPGTQQMPNQQDVDKIKGFYSEIVQTMKKGPAIQVDSNGLVQAQAVLKKLWPPMQSIDRTFLTAYLAFGEVRVRGAMRGKILVQQNARDSSGIIKDYLSITPVDLRKLETFMGQYYNDLKKSQDARKNQAQTAAVQTQQAQPQQPAKPPQSQPAPPLNRKQSQQGQGRKASASTKAPPAPTENKTFWGAPSPHGIPKYEANRTELTADKLKFPPQKKRRTGTQPDSQDSTPAAQTGTPGATAASPKAAGAKVPTPAPAKKMQAQPKPAEPEKPKFKCDDSSCEASINGFETQELLKQHKDSMHQPIEDPLKYMLENAASALDVDQEGKPLPPPKEAKTVPQSRAKPAPVAKAGIKKEAQKPNIKRESTTPGTPNVGGKVATKPGITDAGKKGVDAKPPDSTVEVSGKEKEKTLMQAMAEKIGFKLPEEDAKVTTVFELSVQSADESWLSMLTNELSDAAEMDSDWSRFNGVTDWGLRPDPESSPELTPSDSQSSRASDISQTERLRINFEWDAFGNGDTGVPEMLAMQTLGLNESTDVARGEDITRVDGDAKKDGVAMSDAQKDVHKVQGQWDWSADLTDWDTMFGPNAGLENDMDWSNAGIVL